MELQELSTINFQDFSGYLNQTFNIHFGGEVVLPSELIEATELTGYSPLERKPFSIVFRTQQKGEYYQQATFNIQHPEKGDISMFLVPKGFDNIGMKYEAVFS
jgi:hypothetical protein